MHSHVWIGPLAAAIALPLAYGLLRRLAPAPEPEPSERCLEELHEEFGRWLGAGFAAWLLFTPLVGTFCWKAFRVLGARIAAELPAGTYTSLPGGLMWALPAAFFGMLVSAVLVDAVLRLLLRHRHREFARYQELRMGLNDVLALPLLVVLCVAAALFFYAIVDWYVVVTPDEIVVDGFLTVREQRYAHADVVEIETAPYLKALLGGRPRRISVIRYADGRSWTIDNMPGPISNAQILEITHYVSERSGVPVTEVESIRREIF